VRALDFNRIPAQVVELCRKLAVAGHEAYLVGGGVRDLLLELPVNDWDVATSAAPRQVQALFPRTIPLGIQHGTVAVQLRGMQVEVTTFRGEGAYSDGRHPDSVTFVRTLEEDLQRRDFTVNAIALDPLARQVIDPMNGQADLDARLIRAVGAPLARFSEDGLRTMRAVRFAATLEFDVDAQTVEAMARSLESLRKVSRERIRDELLKLLGARAPAVGLELMRRTGLLGEVLPELPEPEVDRALAAAAAVDGPALVRLAALLVHTGACDEACRRLRLSNQERRRTCHLVAHHGLLDAPGADPARQRRIAHRIGREALEEALALRGGLVAAAGEGRRAFEELAAALRRVIQRGDPLQIAELAVDGAEVADRLGGPGPAVGRVLRALLERVLEDPALNERDRLLALVDELRSRQ
jgi:tRNA nucleotidyltransferase (CCA-adding enzyme)